MNRIQCKEKKKKKTKKMRQKKQEWKKTWKRRSFFVCVCASSALYYSRNTFGMGWEPSYLWHTSVIWGATLFIQHRPFLIPFMPCVSNNVLLSYHFSSKLWCFAIRSFDVLFRRLFDAFYWLCVMCSHQIQVSIALTLKLNSIFSLTLTRT